MADTTNTVDAVNDNGATVGVVPLTVDVIANDTGTPLTVTGFTPAANGTVVDNGDGTFTYTPNAAFNGVDSFTYTISDGAGGQDTATVTIQVAGCACACVANSVDAVNDAEVTALDTPVDIAVLGNDSDPQGDSFAVIANTDPANGTVTVTDGVFTYTPNTGFTGTDVFTYTVEDAEGATDTAVVTILVDGAAGNSAPDAVDDMDSTAVETPIILDPLANDSDPEDDVLRIVAVGSPANGTAVLNDDGTVTYTPDPGFTGVDHFTYVMTDDLGGVDEATVTITVADRSGLDGIVEGTPGDDIIDPRYTDDPEGDMVDAGDAIDPLAGPDDDWIEAGAGDDTILSGEGDDTVYAGTGDDVIETGNGADLVFGNEGDDIIDTSGEMPLSDHGFDSSSPYYSLDPLDPDMDDDKDEVHGGYGNDIIKTGDDADIVYGDEGDDIIDGGLDDDRLCGNDGNDTIIGGHGADMIWGNDGDDVIYGGLGPNTDPFNLPDSIDPRPENGIDTIYGGAGDDVIYGQDDNDIIYGDEGNDRIDGGIDNDEMYGGDDRDTFVNVNPGDYVDGNEGGDDWDTLDLRGSAPEGGTLVVTLSDDNPENGTVSYFDADGNAAGTLDFVNIEEIVPCFTPGTLIATPKGEIPVEMLRAGDRVLTRDNGIQEIAWMGSKKLGWRQMELQTELKPVLIKAGALGRGLPERDMVVSPNHRILVTGERPALFFDEREVFVAAKHLIDGDGIVQVESREITYVHFMFEHHEVVLSDGAWTESFQPGDYSLKGVGEDSRDELMALFPELQTSAGREDFTAARRILKRHEANMLKG